ncbi:hypothetical protein Syun_027944 [Stephania yunnanensis]|uniref:Uncharacterized protein n=1 Tax=Stephania yunnanensis TaxID=152371 RepID=A0AAP0EM10_9MAGN
METSRSGYFKIKFDTAVVEGIQYVGIGSVIIDKFGYVHGAHAKRFDERYITDVVELLIVREDENFLTNGCLETIIDSVPGMKGMRLKDFPSFYCCNGWDIGMEIDNNVKMDKVESLVRELIEGDQEKEMKRNAEEWKKNATKATRYGGSSFLNFERLVNEVILQKSK